MNYLTKIQKSIPHFFAYFKDPHVLAISEDKTSLPFAFVIHDDDVKHHLLLSVAIDAPSLLVAELALRCYKVVPTILSQGFYIAKNGTTYLGEDAHKYLHLDRELPIEYAEPETNLIH